jgi:hypothetical protein
MRRLPGSRRATGSRTWPTCSKPLADVRRADARAIQSGDSTTSRAQSGIAGVDSVPQSSDRHEEPRSPALSRAIVVLLVSRHSRTFGARTSKPEIDRRCALVRSSAEPPRCSCRNRLRGDSAIAAGACTCDDSVVANAIARRRGGARSPRRHRRTIAGRHASSHAAITGSPAW